MNDSIINLAIDLIKKHENITLTNSEDNLPMLYTICENYYINDCHINRNSWANYDFNIFYDTEDVIQKYIYHYIGKKILADINHKEDNIKVINNHINNNPIRYIEYEETDKYINYNIEDLNRTLFGLKVRYKNIYREYMHQIQDFSDKITKIFILENELGRLEDIFKKYNIYDHEYELVTLYMEYDELQKKFIRKNMIRTILPDNTKVIDKLAEIINNYNAFDDTIPLVNKLSFIKFVVDYKSENTKIFVDYRTKAVELIQKSLKTYDNLDASQKYILNEKNSFLSSIVFFDNELNGYIYDLMDANETELQYCYQAEELLKEIDDINTNML